MSERAATRPRQRRVDEHPVLLRLRFRLVVVVDVLDRALADQRTRQDHHADEAGRPASGLREHRLRARSRTTRRRPDRCATGPRCRRAARPRSGSGCRVPDGGADTRQPPGGNATLSPRHSRSPSGRVSSRAASRSREITTGTVAPGAGRAGRQIPAPHRRARLARPHRHGVLAVPGLALRDRARAGHRGAAHHVQHARQRRQAEHARGR